MKTTWQKIYSFFGFWTYTLQKEDGTARQVVYWCCFPFYFFRKFDLFSWDVTATEGREAVHRELIRLRARLDGTK